MKSFLLIALVVVAALLVAADAAKLPKKQWQKLSRADKNDRLKFHVALHQQNVDRLVEVARAVSDPDSPSYLQYLSREEVKAIVAIPGLSERVASKLRQRCSDLVIEDGGDVLVVDSSVKCAEKLFSTKLYRWKHITTGRKTIRVAEGKRISVPAMLRDDVYMVTGLEGFPIVRRSVSSRGKVSTGSFDFVIPATVRRVYNIPAKYAVATNAKTTQSVIEFEAAPSLTDMQGFCTQAGEKFYNITTIVGPFDQEDATESTLDVEYLYTVGAGATNWYITLEGGWIYEMAVLLNGLTSPPLVNSLSYGWPESGSCQFGLNCTDPVVYIQRSETELAKLAARGVAILAATQDEGAPSDFNEECQYDNSTDPAQPPVYPIYPASSAWVTGVSSTTLIDSTTGSTTPAICASYPCSIKGTAEQPCMVNNTYYSYTTGGGFSNYTTAPSYQTATIKAWFAKKGFMPPLYAFNNKGRAYGDITAFGARGLIYIDGQVSVEEGTSMSTPIVSGVFSLLNDARLNAGKKPLGFLNPLIYKMGTACPNCFQDIVGGNNRGTIDVWCRWGYGAIPGWDPTSGWGSPNVANMVKYVLSLP